MDKKLIYILCLLLGILFLMLFYFEYKKNLNDKEYFDNQEKEQPVYKVELTKSVDSVINEEEKQPIHIEKGLIENNAKGSVLFEKPFDDVPNVLTQVIAEPGEKPYVPSVIIYNVSKTGFDFAEQTIGVKEVLEEEDDEILVGEEAENTGPNPPMRLLEFIDQTFSFEWIALEK